MGISGEMKLETASGPLKVQHLVDQTVLNPEFTQIVFVWTGTRLFLSEASRFRLLGKQQLFDVTLDDGAVLRVSPLARFVMKSGITKLSTELSSGDSLLPLYLQPDAHGYPTYQVPGKDAKRQIYRLMAEWKVGHKLGRGTVVEHIDGNRKNYHPDNLRITIDERRAVRSYKHSVVKVLEQANKLLDECAAASPKMAKVVGPKKKKKKTNHKVVSVTPGVLGEVYTASVRSEGSLSISGVFLDLPS